MNERIIYFLSVKNILTVFTFKNKVLLIIKIFTVRKTWFFNELLIEKFYGEPKMVLLWRETCIIKSVKNLLPL